MRAAELINNNNVVLKLKTNEKKEEEKLNSITNSRIFHRSNRSFAQFANALEMCAHEREREIHIIWVVNFS